MNILATTVGSQSHDVIVGEVDTVNIPDSPKTGVFKIKDGSAVAAIAIVVPIIIISAYLAKYIHHKYVKK